MRPPAPRADAALVGAVNLLLALGLVTAALGTVAAVWDPALQRGVEEAHSGEVADRLGAFVAALDGLALNGLVNSTAEERLPLAGEARGLLGTSRWWGGVALVPGTNAGLGFQARSTLAREQAASTVEGPMVAAEPPTAPILLGLDRGDPASLARFEVRITDVARLAQENDTAPFRAFVLKAGVCTTPTCPQLALSPQAPGKPQDYKNKVLWAAAWSHSTNPSHDPVIVHVWNGNGQGNSAWTRNSENLVNGESLNLLCDGDTPACPSAAPPSVLDAPLQLWPLLFNGGAGVAGEAYDVWLVRGDRGFGTFRTTGSAPAEGSPTPPGNGAPPPLPIPGTDHALEVRLDFARGLGRTLRLEHGAVLLLEGDRAAMLAPPPFLFHRTGNHTLQAVLRVNALAGAAGAGSSADADLRGTLAMQRDVAGNASLLNLTFPTASCAAWQAWFREAMHRASINETSPTAASGFATSCDPAAGTVTLLVLGPDPSATAQDLRLRLRWTGFRVEVS